MFQRQALQSFSRCTNMPYTLAAGTGKDANFSSFKGDMKNVWEPEVQCEQSRIEWSIIEPVFQWFLESAIYVPGLLDGLPSINAIDHRWHWPPLPELDAVYSANAAAIRLKSGLSTPTSEHARRGQDWDTEAMRAASDFGVPVQVYKQAVFSTTFDPESQSVPSQTSSTLTTATTAVADTAMNGAQVTSIVEIITGVATRAIPPATARALIRSAFPAIPVTSIDEMLAPFAALPNIVQPGLAADAGPQGEYTQLGQRAFTNNQKRIMQTLQKLVDGAVTQVMAEQTLASIGLSSDRISALIADALDGGIEPTAIQEVAV
jgi:hypothetical protein